MAADTLNSTSEIFFRKNAAGTNWEAVTRSGATETITTTTGSVSTMRTLRIDVNDTLSKVFFYIDGSLVATHTTNIPAPGTRLGYWAGITPSTAAAATMDLDYIKIWSDDPAEVATTSNLQQSNLAPVDYTTFK